MWKPIALMISYGCGKIQSNLKVHCAFFELHLDDLLPICVFWSCCRAISTSKRDISPCETDRFGSLTFPPSAIRYQHTISNHNLLIRERIFLSDIFLTVDAEE